MVLDFEGADKVEDVDGAGVEVGDEEEGEEDEVAVLVMLDGLS